LSHCPAAKAASARDKSSSLVGSTLEQPAVATPVRQSAKINPLYLEPMVATLDATEVAQAGRVVLIIWAGSVLGFCSRVGVEFDRQTLGNDCALSAKRLRS